MKEKLQDGMAQIVTSWLICCMLLELYIQNMSIVSLLVLVTQVLLYFWLAFIKEDTKTRKIYYIISLLGLFLLVFAVQTLQGISGVSWIISYGTNYSLLSYAVIFLIVNYIGSSIIFYCSHVVYNMILNFLIMLIPPLWYNRMDIEFPYIYGVVLCFLYFWLLAVRGQQKRGENQKIHEGNEYRWHRILLIALLLIPVVFIPKNQAPVLAKFVSQQTNRGRDSIVERQYMSGRNSVTRSAAGASQATLNTVLFYVNAEKAEDSIYLKRDTHSLYNWQEDNWRYMDVQSQDGAYFETIADVEESFPVHYPAHRALTGQRLLQAIKESGEEEFWKEYFPESESEYTPQGVEERAFSINLNGYYMNVLLYPLESELDEIGIYSELQANRNQVVELTNHFGSMTYRMSYYTQSYEPDKQAVQLASRLTKEEYQELLQKLSQQYPEFWEEYEDANRYYGATLQMEIPTITNLAHTLTDGLNTDYLQVKAIEEYFHTGRFIYDLNPPGGDPDVESFLEEGHRGSCSDYATAMVLLVRSAGIPARYTEGFVLTEYEEDEARYVVRMRHSHAFVEAYISGLGWTVFDPTPGVRASDELVDGDNGYTGQIWQDIKLWFSEMNFQKELMILLIIVVAVAMLMSLRRPIEECRFRMRVRRLKPAEMIVAIYARIWVLLQYKKLAEVRLSSRDMDSILEGKYKTDGRILTETIDRVIYGNVVPEKKDAKEIYKFYRELYHCIIYNSKKGGRHAE